MKNTQTDHHEVQSDNYSIILKMELDKVKLKICNKLTSTQKLLIIMQVNKKDCSGSEFWLDEQQMFLDSLFLWLCTS